MAFDFKKEYKEFYMPKNKPEIVTVPKANYIAVRGKGDPNKEGGEYQQAISVLYAVAYTLKMSYKTDYKIEGFFEYVVPPLEGFWWKDDMDGIGYTNKSSFNWISVIRLPDFITQKDFEWAVETATKKKKLDCSSAEFMTIDEGLCIQIMHFGSFDDEPATVALMDEYLDKNGYVNDITDTRLHHEIYLSDARRVAPEKWKTVIRHPIKKIETTSSLQKKENLMKRILVVLGGGRPKGNTRQLADAFIQGAVDAGHEIELVSLNQVEVKGCIGCNACRYGKPCVQKDGFSELVPKIKAADLLVFASPLLFWTISAKLKAFIERFYCLAEEDANPPLGRYEKYPVKDAALLMTSADNLFWTYEQAVSYYKFTVIHYIGFHDKGMLLAGGCGDTNGKPQISKTNHLKEAYEFGKTIYRE